MASSKWYRRWLYDSKVKVPKTTRWRRKLDYGSPVTEHGNGDHADEGDISSIIGGLRNDTSPFKKQKLIDDCHRLTITLVATKNPKLHNQITRHPQQSLFFTTCRSIAKVSKSYCAFEASSILNSVVVQRRNLTIFYTLKQERMKKKRQKLLWYFLTFLT